MQHQYAFRESQKYGFLKAGMYVLIVVYLVNSFTPLRLHVDMLRYFAIKDCIESGCPPDSEASRDYLPFGYTALLLCLSKIGLLKSYAIVLINCAYLFGALYLVKKMFGASFQTMSFLILVLLNWTTIKFVTHPLSEMQYLFFSMASVYFFYQFTKDRRVLNLFLTFIFGALSFITRSVGIALAAALMVSLVWQYKKELILLIKKNKIVAAILGIIVIGVAIFSKQLGLNHYTGVFTKQFDEGVGLGEIVKWHFTEWAELSLNTSIVKLEPYLPAFLAKWGIIFLGIAVFAAISYLIFFRKNSIPFIVKAYLAFYTILMFTWPFYDPRFWVPVVPLIIASIVQVPIASFRSVFLKKMAYCFVIVYVSFGIISVSYMTYTSLNKRIFSRTQANGVYRNEYETFFFDKPQSDTTGKVDPVILDVLKRYDK